MPRGKEAGVAGVMRTGELEPVETAGSSLAGPHPNQHSINNPAPAAGAPTISRKDREQILIVAVFIWAFGSFASGRECVRCQRNHNLPEPRTSDTPVGCVVSFAFSGKKGRER